MSFDVIKEQRMVRTLFYSLITSAELIAKDKQLSEEFVTNVSKFIRERTIIDEGTRDVKEVIRNHVQTLGWKNIKCNINPELGTGHVSLGKNRYVINEIADSDGALLTLRAIFEGICFHMLKHPVKADVSLAMKADSHYEVNFSRRHEASSTTVEEKSPTTSILTDRAIHQSLKIEHLFNPIFTKEIPTVILFETAWKVITESLIANFSAENDAIIKEALKIPTLENLSIIIMKLTEGQEEKEIINMAEIIGEFFIKILKSRISVDPFNTLISTLRDKHAKSYLLYYECRNFCAERKFAHRCTFIRGMWIGILNEIFGFQVKVNELMHAGKRDSYCMLELVREEEVV